MIEPFREFLSVPDFVSRAWSAVASLSGDEYRMRQPEGSKQLIEEIAPLAVLLLHLWSPRYELRCRFVGESANHDAEVTFDGSLVDRQFFEPRYFVEVTTAAHPDEHLRREALTRNGFVYLGGPIRRVDEKGAKRRPLVSEPLAVDGDAVMTEAAKWIADSLARKAEKDYPSPCILLINVEPERPLSLNEWARVQHAVSDKVDRERFKWTYVVHCSRNFAHAI